MLHGFTAPAAGFVLTCAGFVNDDSFDVAVANEITMRSFCIPVKIINRYTM